MRIVAAEIDSVGNDIDYSGLQTLGDVTFYEDKITEENAKTRLEGVEVLCINKSKITQAILDDADDLKLICEFATGFDNVDLKACTAREIKVANVAGYSTSSVAQHTFALLFYLMESLKDYDEFVKSGEYAAQDHFSKVDIPFHELEGVTWGIIGMGNIGRKVAHIAEAFGAKVIFCPASGRSTHNSDDESFEMVTFDELLRRSDVLSLHCPLSDKTRNLIDKDALVKMKKTAILINVARGPVVNEEDLTNALINGEIAAAGLDVLSVEPMRKDNPLLKIQDSSKLLITPHMAWASVEARTRCVDEVKKNILAYERGENRNIVNL
ncbi:NAD(P)-dependent oxidoreductase [Butyrivibrio sp. LC3010]|uniref:NAD(P)-dependent oxidoreductase n=1 Tax=Butyrivibrio sp. LC3010 TaxID=1280680 RepID=UPI0003F8D61F|nr:NAD(P)-dependent oxidoreductase [Butyrivibrio sp. LC3010]